MNNPEHEYINMCPPNYRSSYATEFTAWFYF